MATKLYKVSVELSNDLATATILPFSNKGIVAVHAIYDNGDEDLDIMLRAHINADNMISEVIEYTKVRGQFQRVLNGVFSGRYTGQIMTLSDEVYLETTTGKLKKSEDEIYKKADGEFILDEDGNKILNNNLVPAYSAFEAMTRFKTAEFNDMASRFPNAEIIN
jgi:hypothetical protein